MKAAISLCVLLVAAVLALGDGVPHRWGGYTSRVSIPYRAKIEGLSDEIENGTIADVAISSLSDNNTVYVEYTPLQTGKISIGLFQDDRNLPFNIGIHYNWRGDTNKLVLNSAKNNQWQREIFVGGFPFDSRYLIAVKIVPSSEAYKIYANGKHIYDFKYRSDGTPDKVNRVRVITQGTSQQPVQVTQLLVI